MLNHDHLVLGGGGSGKNDHEFRMLGNIELYERPLTLLETMERGRETSH